VPALTARGPGPAGAWAARSGEEERNDQLRAVSASRASSGPPVRLELGGESPNIFLADVARARDDFYDKALEGFTMFALNQGEVCTCPSRALIQESIYDQFIADAVERTKAVTQGNPLDTDTMIGAQASNDQLEKILSCIEIGRREGAAWLSILAAADPLRRRLSPARSARACWPRIPPRRGAVRRVSASGS
jgi:acyl-CoA reductase-like NAD-dependent aldehyde dehydrogenase